MNEVKYLTIDQESSGQRLDNYLIRLLKGVPKSYIYRIIRGGEVRVNKKRAQVSSRLEAGDIVRVPPTRQSTAKNPQVSTSLADCLTNNVIYEDNQLLVINKPSGLAVHGGSGLSLGVIEALRQTRKDIPYLELVHRLDKETSGCLLLAKKRSILRALQAQLAERKVVKIYWALLSNPWVGKKTLEVDASLEKNTLQSGERIVKVNDTGKASSTRFRLLENYSQACWVEASPKTGRTHQIRVHAAHLGHAIIGDDKYGQKGLSIEGIHPKDHKLYLHARSIQFNLNDKDYLFTAELDDKFKSTLAQFAARSLENDQEAL